MQSSEMENIITGSCLAYSVRSWKVEDSGVLFPLILAYLREVEGDYDYLPTEDNARFLVVLGGIRAEAGDPVLLAEAEGQVVGWTSWIGAVSDLIAFGERVCIGMGTYVAPEHRRRGVA